MKLNLSTNRRKLGAIGLIAASIIAFSIPFLLHSPTSANTTTSNPKGPGTTGTNTNTNPSGTSTNPSGSGDNGNGSKGNEACDSENDIKTGDPAVHAYAYGHGKNGNKDKGVVSMVVEKLHKLGSGMGTHHQTHSTRTDNHLDAHDQQGDSNSQSSQGTACPDDEADEKD